MDQTRFDSLTRRLGAGATRRAGLKAVLGGLLGVAAGAAALPARDGAAKRGKKKKRALCPAVCPSGSACIDGACACTRELCGGTCCAGNQTCQDGTCVETGLRDCGSVRIVDGADLSHCNLRGRKIDVRTVRNANFEGADLTDAKFTGQFQPHGCRFDRANLTRASLDECDIKPGTTFEGANLSGARLTNGHIDGADFEGATLRGADFKMTRMANARFVDAELRDAILDGVIVSGSDFGGAGLHRATIRNVTVTDSAFVQADFSDAIFDKKFTFRRTDFSRASFSHVDMVHADDKSTFADCVFDDASFYQVYTTNTAAILQRGAEHYLVTNCRFHRTRFYSVPDISGLGYQSQLLMLRFTGCDLTGARLDHSDLCAVRFTDCILDGADLSSTGIGVKSWGENEAPTMFTRTRMKGAKLDGMHQQIDRGHYFDARFVDVDLEGASLGSGFPGDRVALLRTSLIGTDGWPSTAESAGYRCSSVRPDGSPMPDTHWHDWDFFGSIPCSQAPRPGS